MQKIINSNQLKALQTKALEILSDNAQIYGVSLEALATQDGFKDIHDMIQWEVTKLVFGSQLSPSCSLVIKQVKQ